MNEHTGYIKIHRKIIDWGWYQDKNVFILFMHLLLTANYKDSMFQGQVIRRGQVVTGRLELAKSTTRTVQQIRTALDKLKSTGEITIKTTNKYSIITLVNYELYQDKEEKNNQQNNQVNNHQITIKQPTNNQQITTSKEIKNRRGDNNTSSPSFNYLLNPPTPLKECEGVFENDEEEGEEGIITVKDIVKTMTAVDVVNLLTENTKKKVKQYVPKWDLFFLADAYIRGINEGFKDKHGNIVKREFPKNINAAFPSWCVSYTKGKEP